MIFAPALRGRHEVHHTTHHVILRWSYDLHLLSLRHTLPPPVPLSDAHLLQFTQVPTCNDVGNYVYSCYPTSNTTVNQGDWTRLIWNPAVPSFMGAAVTNPLDIYLFHADSDVQVANWTNVPAATGHQSVQVADSFWGNQGAQFTGGQEPYPMYFVITLSGSTLNGAESRLATWTALQTALPASVISASSASVRSQAASASLSSVAATATRTPNPNLQGSGGGSSSDFPAWAIALVVVLGVLAAVALALLAYLLVRNIREKSRLAAAAVHRDSIHSASPMMANADMSHVQSPQSPTGPHEGYVGGGGSSAAHGHPGSIHRPGGVANDGASTVSESGPFSGADAMIMADAFRQALRKPDFAGRQEEGESPDTGDTGAEVARKELINRELAEEGRDIMSVSSGRGVTVGTGREEAPT
ncbi:hypothetical protein BOTBODRAFT_454829 [Botryobasidium botryosum FD-172 SS1]|uniref:Uncharacterized protein n=1 Tax=Botryobasidium botryosum (strain FD-172 SS1) TaxID=930990 RepID=A0A067MIN0_BOTB1|nr:hypothetical protein BOTBODRAFT_454829 [Botryobasidium botryosum FD-172 SS1]